MNSLNRTVAPMLGMGLSLLLGCGGSGGDDTRSGNGALSDGQGAPPAAAPVAPSKGTTPTSGSDQNQPTASGVAENQNCGMDGHVLKKCAAGLQCSTPAEGGGAMTCQLGTGAICGSGVHVLKKCAAGLQCSLAAGEEEGAAQLKCRPGLGA